MAYNLEIKKRRILKSARGLLVGHGLQNLTLDEVAKNAGVAKGTLFLHYKSKEELLRAAYLDLAYSLEAALKKIEDSDLKGQTLLEKTAEAILSYLDVNSDFLLQIGPDRFSGCGPKSCRELAEKISGDMGHLQKILVRCSKSSDIAIRDYSRSACFFFGLCRASLLYRIFVHKGESLKSRAKRVVHVFLNGVAIR